MFTSAVETFSEWRPAMNNHFFPKIKNMTLDEAVKVLQRYDDTEFSDDFYKGCGCPIYTDFTGVRVKNGEYIDCIFKGNNFKYTGAAGSHFRKCEFNSCNINGSNMQFCDFSNSIFCNNTKETHLIQGTNFNQSCFYNTTFQNVLAKNSSVCQSQFLNTKIKDSSFQHVTLQDNIFRDTDIIHSSFIGCNFEYTDFIDVRIYDSILPFHQIPYIYGGFQCISKPGNTVKITSSMENAEILPSYDYIKLLPAFIKYYEDEFEYFPLANIALFLKDFSSAKKYINSGLKEYIRTREFRKLKSLCKLITRNGNFARNELLEFYFDILTYFNSIELSPGEHYQFGLHIDEIKNILFGVTHMQNPHVEIILKTNLTIEEGTEIIKIISIIEDCLSYYHIKNEEYNIELKHNSPSYSLWLLISSLDPNLIVMSIGMLYSVFSGDINGICQAVSTCADIMTIAAFIRELTNKKPNPKYANNTADLPADREIAYAESKHKLLKEKTKIEFSLGNVHFNYTKKKTYQ